ncbi:hypothetical protein GCM10027597_05000 [Saccharopolyspora tripterygii]
MAFPDTNAVPSGEIRVAPRSQWRGPRRISTGFPCTAAAEEYEEIAEPTTADPATNLTASVLLHIRSNAGVQDSSKAALDQTTRSLARPLAGANEVLAWESYCDETNGFLARNVQAWQRLAGFQHHRAGTVLVAFRASWLALCATVPEHHFGWPVPSLAEASVVVDADGLVHGLVLRDRSCANAWWPNVSHFLAPLTRGLEAIGGPPADSDQYWGNAVGLLGEVLRRLAADGAGGDVLATAVQLRAETGRADLLDVGATQSGLWSRRRTCCQLWRSGTGYCTECVLHNAPRRKPR